MKPIVLKNQPRRFRDYINNKLHKITTADISVDWGFPPSRAGFSGYNSHAAKVRTRSKPPNKIKKKVEFNHKKSGETSEKATRTSEKQKRNEQKRRLRARNKSTDSERTKRRLRTNQSELRTRSRLRARNKKEGCENPSKNIRVVLWNETRRFERPNPVVLGIIKNIMLLNINEVMANSTYVGVAESHKGVKRVV